MALALCGWCQREITVGSVVFARQELAFYRTLPGGAIKLQSRRVSLCSHQPEPGLWAIARGELGVHSGQGSRPSCVRAAHRCSISVNLDNHTPWAYSQTMLTVVETTLFQRQWPYYWSEDERGMFAAYIAEHPTAGDVVPGSGGIRKVRWGRSGSGKSGGVRVIYFTRNAEGEVVLLTLYAKAKTNNLTGPQLKELRRALEE